MAVSFNVTSYFVVPCSFQFVADHSLVYTKREGSSVIEGHDVQSCTSSFLYTRGPPISFLAEGELEHSFLVHRHVSTMYRLLLLVALGLRGTLTSALARPNAMPKYQQEIVQPSPGLDTNNNIHFQSTIRDVLLANQIIPQVLDDFEPTYYLDISYPQDHEKVLMGNNIPVESVSKRPSFTFHPLTGPPDYGDPPNDKDLIFTLALTDPDALSRKHPVKSEMCHWIVTNLTTPIVGVDSEWPDLLEMVEEFEQWAEHEIDLDLDLNELMVGKKPGEVESYVPPAPPKKTGPHRYVFVLLEGDVSKMKPPKERPHWGYGKERHGVRDWSEENDLTVVGANFFFASHKKQ